MSAAKRAGIAGIIDFLSERERYHARAKRDGAAGDLGPVLLADAAHQVLEQLDEAEQMLRDLGYVEVRLSTKPDEACLCPSETGP